MRTSLSFSLLVLLVGAASACGHGSDSAEESDADTDADTDTDSDTDTDTDSDTDSDTDTDTDTDTDWDPVVLGLESADLKIVGAYDELAATSIAGGFDTDGDGHDDLLVGAPEGHGFAGAAYLVLGPLTGKVDTADADATLIGEAKTDNAGYSVAGGDVDGDGNGDLAIVSHSDDEGGANAGAAYVVLGPVSGTHDLSVADAKLVGEDAGDALNTVAFVGDANADGFGDLALAAFYHDGGGEVDSGTVYFVLGPVTGTLDLSLATARLIGEDDHDDAGSSVAGAGDVDADGNDDLIVGAAANTEGLTYSGAAYLVLGPPAGAVGLESAQAKLVGEKDHGFLGDGNGVSGAGDVDGDGYDDLIVSCRNDSESATRAGAAYIVRGPVAGTIYASDADAKLLGPATVDGHAGDSVASAGDVNGDGNDDVMVGAHDDNEVAFGAGKVYVALGPFSGTSELASARVTLLGEGMGDHAGSSVSSAGDVDGDGHLDLFVAAEADNEGGTEAGAAYLVLNASLH